MLWSICWSTYNFVPANFANTIDVHVSRLRRKLADADSGVTINGIRGVGYLLRETT